MAQARGVGAQSIRAMIYCLDSSESMTEPGKSGKSKLKEAITGFNEGMRLFLSYLERETASPGGSRLSERAMDYYIAVCYFGESGFDENKDYLFNLVTGKKVDTIYNLLQAYKKHIGGGEKPESFNVVNPNDYYSVNHDGTDVGQVVVGVRKALEYVANNVVERGRPRLRAWLVILGDGCYNKYKGVGLTVSNVYDKVFEARKELETTLADAHRAIIHIIYGRGIKIEDDSDICPARAALIADSLDFIKAKGVIYDKLQSLEKDGTLSRDDPNIFEFELPDVSGSAGGLVRDYAVWRLKDFSKLARVIFELTTGPVYGG